MTRWVLTPPSQSLLLLNLELLRPRLSLRGPVVVAAIVAGRGGIGAVVGLGAASVATVATVAAAPTATAATAARRNDCRRHRR